MITTRTRINDEAHFYDLINKKTNRDTYLGDLMNLRKIKEIIKLLDTKTMKFPLMKLIVTINIFCNENIRQYHLKTHFVLDFIFMAIIKVAFKLSSFRR